MHHKSNEYIYPDYLVGVLLPKLNRKFSRNINNILYKYHLSHLEWVIIIFCLKKSTLAEMQTSLGVVSTVVSKYVLQLEKKGILESDFDYSDKEAKLVWVKEGFYPVAEKINLEISRYFNKFFSVISKNELFEFSKVLHKLTGDYAKFERSIIGIPPSGIPNYSF